MFLRDFKRVQQACRPLSKSFSMFACYAVEGVTINIIIQNKPVIVKLNLALCSVLSLIITKWLIVNESEKLSNHTLKDLKMMIFVKN